jgi:hypothetical protein
MGKKLLFVASFLFICACSVRSFADSVYGLTVDQVMSWNASWGNEYAGGVGFTCGNRVFLIKPNDIGLQSSLAILMTALVNGKTIDVECTNTIPASGEIGDVKRVLIHK